ncbi:MAG: hypothetical protein ACK6AT_06970 [Planctomycetota bacterium]
MLRYSLNVGIQGMRSDWSMRLLLAASGLLASSTPTLAQNADESKAPLLA